MASPELGGLLRVGQTLDHYRIAEEIGAGGMGVVYRAHDEHLDREVAIKVLPRGTLADQEARKRFRKEALALSKLNHPNIATIHDFDTQGDLDFLVMEYVPGETLRKKISTPPLPERETVRLAVQLAHGLGAAHEQGLVHRDLKPENVRLTLDGRPKILDFGLAKLIRPLSDLCTTQTNISVIAGTLPYMAPEQVVGGTVDHRADIFSFGTVLYEMSTGQHPFADADCTSLAAAILQRPPTKPRTRNPHLSAELERIIEKALEKDRSLRYQSAADMRTDLQRLKHDSQAAKPEAASPFAIGVRWQPTSSSVAILAKKHKLGVVAGLITAVVVLGAAVIGVDTLLHRRAAMPFQNFTVTQVTNSGKAARTAISPDGKYVLSVIEDNGLNSLWLRNVPTGSDTQVIPPSASHYESLAFSPDGNYIYFRKARNATLTGFDLYRAPVLGGRAETIVQDIDSDIAFSSDGERIAYARANDPDMGKYRLLTATSNGKDDKVLLSGPEEETPYFLTWAPNGKQIAYDSLQRDSGKSTISLLDVETRNVHPLAVFQDKTARELKWSPDGRVIFVNYSPTGNFLRAQIGLLPRAGVGFQPITRDTNSYATLTASADGRTLATVQTKATRNLYLLPSEGTRSPQPPAVRSDIRYILSLNWDADGTLLASDGARLWRMGADARRATQLLGDPNAAILNVSGCGGRFVVFTWPFHEGTTVNIWRVNADGSNPVRLTTGKTDLDPVCSRDQKWVYYVNLAANQIWRVPLDGSRTPEPITAGTRFPGLMLGNAMSVSHDGKTLAYTAVAVDPKTQESISKIVLLNLESADSSRMLNANPRITGGVQFTPDGHGIAYPIRDKGIDNLWVQPLDGSAGRQITNFTSDQIAAFHWSPDGKVLALLSHNSESDVVLLRESKQ